MTMTKVRVRIGQVEVDYEGDEAFLDSKLMDLVEKLRVVAAKQPAQPAPTLAPQVGSGAKPPVSTGQMMSTRTIATKLAAKKGPDVGRAAVAHLGLIKGKETFSRADIHDEMKTATGIYKVAMFGNLSQILTSLVSDGVIIDTGNEVYALTPGGDKALRGAIGLT